MAQSRLEKIGTIFTRVTGLLRSGAMKPEDKPIWYDLYEAFPPKLEPRFDRPAPKDLPIRNIFYEEDVARAKFHKTMKQQEMINLFDRKRETQSQHFIKIYQGLKSQGALDEEKIFETSVELLQQERQQMKADSQEALLESAESLEDSKPSLTEAFNEAKQAKEATSNQNTNRETNKQKSNTKNSIGGIDIQNLFKD
ncbi:probable 28S ribosomal protein S23, mitochondrial [Lucilia cuprina]|uniref:probable 28S ribosomal protein S23, mitochondrial n=1 Tax=Lucilia cuprina TaxID=7375 RepID=UPI001F052309|nr:probable 28S ribosomal protein S23, mitochondrial [Lucilia cuprina]